MLGCTAQASAEYSANGRICPQKGSTGFISLAVTTQSDGSPPGISHLRLRVSAKLSVETHSRIVSATVSPYSIERLMMSASTLLLRAVASLSRRFLMAFWVSVAVLGNKP